VLAGFSILLVFGGFSRRTSMTSFSRAENFYIAMLTSIWPKDAPLSATEQAVREAPNRVEEEGGEA